MEVANQIEDPLWPNPPMKHTEFQLNYRVDVESNFIYHSNFLIPCMEGEDNPDLWEGNVGDLANLWETKYSPYVRDKILPIGEKPPLMRGLRAHHVAKVAVTESWERKRWENRAFPLPSSAFNGLSACGETDEVKEWIRTDPSGYRLALPELKRWVIKHLTDRKPNSKRSIDDTGEDAENRPLFKRPRREGRYWPEWVQKDSSRESALNWDNQMIQLSVLDADVDNMRAAQTVEKTCKALKGVSFPEPTYHGAAIDNKCALRVGISAAQMPHTVTENQTHIAGLEEDHFRILLLLLIYFEDDIDKFFPYRRRAGLSENRNGNPTETPSSVESIRDWCTMEVWQQSDGARYENTKEGDRGLLEDENALRSNIKPPHTNFESRMKPLRTIIDDIVRDFADTGPPSTFDVDQLVDLSCRTFHTDRGFSQGLIGTTHGQRYFYTNHYGDKPDSEDPATAPFLPERVNKTMYPNKADNTLDFNQHEGCLNGYHIHLWVQFLSSLIRYASGFGDLRKHDSLQKEEVLRQALGNPWLEWHDGKSQNDLFDLLGFDTNNPVRRHFEKRAAYYAAPSAEHLDVLAGSSDSDDKDDKDDGNLPSHHPLPEIITDNSVNDEKFAELREVVSSRASRTWASNQLDTTPVSIAPDATWFWIPEQSDTQALDSRADESSHSFRDFGAPSPEPPSGDQMSKAGDRGSPSGYETDAEHSSPSSVGKPSKPDHSTRKAVSSSTSVRIVRLQRDDLSAAPAETIIRERAVDTLRDVLSNPIVILSGSESGSHSSGASPSVPAAQVEPVTSQAGGSRQFAANQEKVTSGSSGSSLEIAEIRPVGREKEYQPAKPTEADEVIVLSSREPSPEAQKTADQDGKKPLDSPKHVWYFSASDTTDSDDAGDGRQKSGAKAKDKLAKSWASKSNPYGLGDDGSGLLTEGPENQALQTGQTRALTVHRWSIQRIDSDSNVFLIPQHVFRSLSNALTDQSLEARPRITTSTRGERTLVWEHSHRASYHSESVPHPPAWTQEQAQNLSNTLRRLGGSGSGGSQPEQSRDAPPGPGIGGPYETGNGGTDTHFRGPPSGHGSSSDGYDGRSRAEQQHQSPKELDASNHQHRSNVSKLGPPISALIVRGSGAKELKYALNDSVLALSPDLQQPVNRSGQSEGLQPPLEGNPDTTFFGLDITTSGPKQPVISGSVAATSNKSKAKSIMDLTAGILNHITDSTRKAIGLDGAGFKHQGRSQDSRVYLPDAIRTELRSDSKRKKQEGSITGDFGGTQPSDSVTVVTLESPRGHSRNPEILPSIETDNPQEEVVDLSVTHTPDSGPHGKQEIVQRDSELHDQPRRQVSSPNVTGHQATTQGKSSKYESETSRIFAETAGSFGKLGNEHRKDTNESTKSPRPAHSGHPTANTFKLPDPSSTESMLSWEEELFGESLESDRET